MTANRFFIPLPAPPDSRLWIEGQEHHHLSRVARIRRGDAIELFDTEGGQYQAVVENIRRERTLVRILHCQAAEKLRTSVRLAQALLKPPAMELLIQKAAELLVSNFVPLETARSVVRLSGKNSSRLVRWERIAREAAKQCKTGLIPVIQPLQSIEDFLAEDDSVLKLVLSERGGTPLKDILREREGPPSAIPDSVCLLIGPEGGWSPDEEERIRNRGFHETSLGRSVLRTETAAIVAAGLVGHFWNS